MINQLDADGRTILSWASERGDHCTVARLLPLGADPDLPDRDGQSPLHRSVRAKSVHSMRLLLDAKADIEAKAYLGWTPLMVSALERDSSFIKLLVSHGADVCASNQIGNTPLHIAVNRDGIEKIRYLLQVGADIGAKNLGGRTMLDLAVIRNSHKALRLLLDPSEPYRALMRTMSPKAICWGASHGDSETLIILHNANVLISYSQDDRQMEKALRIAEWRRDDNQNFVQSIFGLADDDPGAWFDTFKILYEGIIDRRDKERQTSHQ